MLNEVQKKAFEEGFALYQEYCSFEDALCDAALDKLEEALGVLGEHIDDLNDEVDAIFYQIIFANVVQDMQDSGKFNLSENCQEKKIDIHLHVLKWFTNTENYIAIYKPFLWSVFNKLSREFLVGKELQQSDHWAWRCLKCNQTLAHPMASMMMGSFVEGDDGKMIYTGSRPE